MGWEDNLESDADTEVMLHQLSGNLK